jgi:gamma-glutamyl:cysteine ligase YbdK (ATP-grasp superfamily)
MSPQNNPPAAREDNADFLLGRAVSDIGHIHENVGQLRKDIDALSARLNKVEILITRAKNFLLALCAICALVSPLVVYFLNHPDKWVRLAEFWR